MINIGFLNLSHRFPLNGLLGTSGKMCGTLTVHLTNHRRHFAF